MIEDTLLTRQPEMARRQTLAAQAAGTDLATVATDDGLVVRAKAIEYGRRYDALLTYRTASGEEHDLTGWLVQAESARAALAALVERESRNGGLAAAEVRALNEQLVRLDEALVGEEVNRQQAQAPANDAAGLAPSNATTPNTDVAADTAGTLNGERVRVHTTNGGVVEGNGYRNGPNNTFPIVVLDGRTTEARWISPNRIASVEVIADAPPGKVAVGVPPAAVVDADELDPAERWASVVRDAAGPGVLEDVAWPRLAAALDRAQSAGWDVAANLPGLVEQGTLPERRAARELRCRLMVECEATLPAGPRSHAAASAGPAVTSEARQRAEQARAPQQVSRPAGREAFGR